MTTRYCNLVTGNNASAGTSPGTAKKDLTAFSATAVAGDTIRVGKSPDPVSLGNADWTNNSSTLTLASAVTQTVTQCDTIWPNAGSGSGLVMSLDSGEGRDSSCTKIAIGSTISVSSPTAPPLPYFQFSVSPVDFSANQYLMLWIKTDVPLTANILTVNLSPNTDGSSGDAFLIDIALPANLWVPIVLDNGGPMINNAKSVGLRGSILNAGVQTPRNIWIDGIVAAPDLSLTYNSLIGKNIAGETWYNIRYIDDTTVKLDQGPTVTLSSLLPQYFGTTETIETFTRETITPALNGIAVYQSINFSGSISSLITISGGWDAAMTTQDGETWIDGRDSNGYGLSISGSHIKLEKFYTRRWDYNYYFTGDNLQGTLDAGASGSYNIYLGGNATLDGINGCIGGGNSNLYTNADAAYIGYVQHCNGATNGITQAGQHCLISGEVDLRGTQASTWNTGGGRLGEVDVSYGSQGIQFNGNTSKITCDSYTADTMATHATTLQGATVELYNFTSTNLSGSNHIGINTNGGEVNHLFQNTNIGAGTLFSSGLNQNTDAKLHFQKQGGDPDVNITYYPGGTVETDISDRHVADGYAYKTTITANYRTKPYPIKFSSVQFAVLAGQNIEFKQWAKKSHASNISARLIIYGGRLSGISSDVQADINTTSWTEFTLSVSPTEDGVVEVFLETWSNNGSTSVTSHIHDYSIDLV